MNIYFKKIVVFSFICMKHINIYRKYKYSRDNLKMMEKSKNILKKLKLISIEELTLFIFSGNKSHDFKNFYNKCLDNHNEIRFKEKQQSSQNNSIKLSFDAFSLLDFYIF